MSGLGAPWAGARIDDPGGGDPRYALASWEGPDSGQPACLKRTCMPGSCAVMQVHRWPARVSRKVLLLVPEARVSCAGLFGCMRHPACYTVMSGALEMRRAVYFLLVVSLVQLSGLTAVCVPCQSQTHPCCPMPDKTSLPNSSSLPDCCVNYVLNCQASITEARDTHSPSEYTAQSAAAQVCSVVPFVAINRSVLQHVSLPISPPLSPLSQSCLLLI